MTENTNTIWIELAKSRERETATEQMAGLREGEMETRRGRGGEGGEREREQK